MDIRQMGEWCDAYSKLQDMYIIPRWTDKLSLDNDGYVRDFNGNVVGYYGEIKEKNND